MSTFLGYCMALISESPLKPYACTARAGDTSMLLLLERGFQEKEPVEPGMTTAPCFSLWLCRVFRNPDLESGKHQVEA